MRRILLIGILIATTAIVAYTVFEGRPHEFKEGDCGTCHVDVSGSPKVMTAPITKLCEPCHKTINRRSSHPVDIVTGFMKIPADFPLTDGRLTCNTCHNIHENKSSVFAEKTYFLRRPAAGREFCLSCHEVNPTRKSHAEIIGIAHTGSKYTVRNKSMPLDALSVACISCHDGSIGAAASTQIGQGVWNHMQGSHPIGVSYQEARMKKGGLHPLNRISRKIRFFDGRIGCETCHDTYSKNPMKLVITNEGSKLCLSCHNK
jgi:predicted CXXCH cytochrome family protein